MSISQSGATGLERLIWLKYYIVLKRQISFNLELDPVKNTHYIKKASNKSLELNFIHKSLLAHMSVSPPPPQSGAMGAKRLIWLKYYIVLKWQITFRRILVCVNVYTCVCKVPSNGLNA